MKEKLKIGFMILIGAALLLYLSISSIMDLTNTKDVHTVTIKEAAEVLELEHSINLIPIGTDYYYMGIDEDYNAYLIKASKKWLSHNFSSNYQALNANGIQIKGLVKKVSDDQTERELENRLSQLEGIEFPLGMLGCLSLNYILIAVLKLIDVVMLVGIFISGRYISKTKNRVNPIVIKVWLVLLIVSMILTMGIIK